MNEIPSVGAGNLPLETQLLLDCLRAGTATPNAELLVRLSTANWATLLEQAAWHDLVPLLYYRLKALGPGATIPVDIEQELRDAYTHSTWRNMRLYHELGQVLAVLRDNDIPAILLKGAHLAQGVYPSIALRSMCDVDLLVRERDLSAVERCLFEMGCVRSGRSTTSCHHSYRTPVQGLLLEVHWDIVGMESPFTLSVDGLWARAQPLSLSDVPVAVLSAEDLLLHLCLHAGFRHGFEVGLTAFCDITEIVRCHGSELDWPLVQARARQWGAGRCVYLTLRLAQELLGTAIPAKVLRSLEPANVDARFVAQVQHQILAQDRFSGPKCVGWGRLRASERPLAKVSVFLASCFPPPKRLAAKYGLPAGACRVYLYYLVHLKDLLGRHAGVAWRLLRRDDQAVAWAEYQAIKAQIKAWLVGDAGRTY
jgi:hypothetical protein